MDRFYAFGFIAAEGFRAAPDDIQKHHVLQIMN